MDRNVFARSLSRTLVVAGFAAALAGCGGEAPESEAEAELTSPAIAERQDNFEGIGDAFKAIRGQLEQESPDLSVIEAKAGEINERAGNIEQHFVEETAREDGYDTEALAAIWQNPEDFDEATQKLIDTSAALVEAAGGGDPAAVGAAVKEMGGACKNCHDQFRYDDEA